MTSSDYVPLSKLGSFTKSVDYCHCICIYAFRNSLRSVLWDIFKSRKTAQLACSYLAREALLGLCSASCLYANIHTNQHTRNQISLEKREKTWEIFSYNQVVGVRVQKFLVTLCSLSLGVLLISFFF